MALKHEEVKPGVVAYLSAASLAADKRVTISHGDRTRVFRDGPWLCVASNGQTAAWLPLTSKQHPEGLRHQLLRSQFRCGIYSFLTTSNYVHDLRQTRTGPVEAFVAASAIEFPRFSNDRPVLMPRALGEVIARMRYYQSFPDLELEYAGE